MTLVWDLKGLREGRGHFRQNGKNKGRAAWKQRTFIRRNWEQLRREPCRREDTNASNVTVR